MQCLHAFVSGRVQGVWFRQSTVETALAHGLSGWVRNLDDGRVELMAKGDEHGLMLLEAWLSIGPALATVAEVRSEWIDNPSDFEGFEIL